MSCIGTYARVIKSKLFLFLAGLLFISAGLFVGLSVPVLAVDDLPAQEYGEDGQGGAAQSAISGSIQQTIARCTIDGAIIKPCIMRECTKFSTVQYQDKCFQKGFKLGSCNPAVISSYRSCLPREATKCRLLYDEAQKQACFQALAWYVSGYHLENPATQTHARARAERLPLFQGGTLNEDGTITPPGGGESIVPEGAGTEDDPETEEDESLTDEEIEQQAQELRDRLAADNTSTCGVSVGPDGTGATETSTVFDFECADVDVAACEAMGDADEKLLCLQRANPVLQLVFTITRVVTYGVGIIITLAIIISGIQYTTAQGDANTVKKARNRIFNAVIALLLYIFAFAILNYLVPGGLIG